MANVSFAIAVLRSGIAYPIRAIPDDPVHNALKRLRPDADTENDRDWHENSLALLDEMAPLPGDHHQSEGASEGAPPLVEANAEPWYAVFEDVDQELWAARFFGPNLPGNATVPGVHIVDDQPELIDLASLDAGTRARRSVIMLSREDFGEDISKGHDHGGGGGVIRTEW